MKTLSIIICVILGVIAVYQAVLLFRDVRQRVKHKKNKLKESACDELADNNDNDN